MVSEGGRYVPPSLPLPLLQRTRLLERLSAAQSHRLTLLHADAGYGKTTLLVQYADLLRAAGRRAAWLTLHRTDEDPVVLLTDLVGSLRRDFQNFGARILGTVQRSRRLDRQLGRLAEACAEELSGLGELVVLIDDHAQLRAHIDLAQFANDLIQLIPTNAHIVYSTRVTPPLPGLSRWRLHGEVLDISAAELAFTRDEAAALLRDQFGLDVPEHAVDTIYARTGGWPAGLRLAASFVRERGWADLAEFRGSAAQLYEYFNNEVLARRSARTTDLLLRWSLLDRVEEETARLIIGREARGVIEQLENAGLVMRDAEVGGYRFQPLFSEFLRARARELLPASDIVDLHRRFADRALEQGRSDQAIYHFQQAGDYKRAAALVKERAEDLLAASEVTTLQRWLDGFPPGVERRLPWVLLMRGVLHRIRGDYERALSHYRDAEDQFRRAKDVTGLARALIWSGQVLRYLRRPREALDKVREGLACVGEGASLQAAWALHVLGGCYADLGEMDAAADSYLRADYLFGLLGHAPGQLAEAQAIAQLHSDLGNLDEAQRNYLRALNLQQTIGDVNVLCWTQSGLVELRARRGDLSEGVETLQQVLELARANGFRVAEAAICSVLALVHGLTGNASAAEDAYRNGVELCRSQGDDNILLRLHTNAAELRALRGDARAAREALRAAEAMIALGEVPPAAARVAIARGIVLEVEAQTTGAYAAYRSAVERAAAIGARYAETKATILAARLDVDPDRAHASIERALRVVTKEGYRDFFLLRPSLVSWLREQLPYLSLAPADAELLSAMFSPTPSAPAAPVTERVAAAAERLQVFLLGSFEVRIAGVRISDRGWRTSKAKELFALLLMNRQRSMGRDELIEALWPESDLTAAVSNFHFTLHSLRKALASVGAGEQAIPVLRVDAGYQLQLPQSIHFDVELFQRSLRRAQDARRAGRSEEAIQHLRSAVAIHRGELLSDLDSPWIEQRREEVTRRFVAACRELAELEIGAKNPQGAIRPCERLLEREPYDEEAHRLLIRAYHEAGDTALAVRHYQALVTLLRRDLDEDPQPATKELYLRLRATAAGRPARPTSAD